MIRATEDELEAWQEAAGEKPSGVWARKILNRAAARAKPKEVVFTSKSEDVRTGTLIIRSTPEERVFWHEVAERTQTACASAPDQSSGTWSIGQWARRALNKAARYA